METYKGGMYMNNFYNYKILIASLVLAAIGSLGSLQSGAYALIVGFIISMVLWYLIISFGAWVAHKLSKNRRI